MLEKTGAVTLTEYELVEAKSGILPIRISQTWGLSLDELLVIIRSGNYQSIGSSASNSDDTFKLNY